MYKVVFFLLVFACLVAVAAVQNEIC
jgi:hypothetical protein